MININQVADNFWKDLRKIKIPPCNAAEQLRRLCAYLRYCNNQGFDPYEKEARKSFLNNKSRPTKKLYDKAIAFFFNFGSKS